jgi:hypothetical protein
MTAADRAARVARVTREAAAPGVTGRRPWMAAVATVVCVTVLAAGCGGGSSGQPGGQVTKTVTASPSSAAPTHAAGSRRRAAAEPGIVAVTARGALVTLNPASGAVTRTLVPSGVIGDEISVAKGTVYFAVRHGCTGRIESVALAGGTPAELANGTSPAISPDGSKLAYATQPSLTTGCVPGQADITRLFKVVVRTVSTAAETAYPMVPASQDNGLPAPISHLSWAPDGRHLAVSVATIQDNEGWGVALVDTAVAKYYLSGPGVTRMRATGEPTPQRSYLREGVYVTARKLFVTRACCSGLPVRNTSRLMWEVNPDGALMRQVAIGFPKQEHLSLDAASRGAWLLYVGGGTLYVSRGGARPREVARDLVAAAWQ